MKKLIFSTVLLLSFCIFLVQTGNSQNDLQSIKDEVTSLKKSNASLKSQLIEQKKAIDIQTQKTESIITLLKSAGNEIKKNADNQTSIYGSIKNLNEKSARVSQAFSYRKKLAIIAFICALIGGIVFLFLLIRKLSAINKTVKGNEADYKKGLLQMNDQMNKEIYELKEIIKQQAGQSMAAIEKLGGESKEMITKLSSDTSASIEKMNAGLNKIIETRIAEVEGSLNEKIKKSDKESLERTGELNGILDSKISAIRNEITLSKNEMNKNLEKAVVDLKTVIESRIKTSEGMLYEKLSTSGDELTKIIAELGKNTENKISTLKSASSAEITEKIAKLEKSADAKITTVKNDLTAGINEINKKLSSHDHPDHKKK